MSFFSEANSPEPADEEPIKDAVMNGQPIRIESPLLQRQQSPLNACVKERANCTTNHKCCERQYTHKDLEEGIEAVIAGKLTPAKAISKYKIPRRTFFRRLSAVRKSRGIPSAKENASDYYHKTYYKNNVMQNNNASPKPNHVLPTNQVSHSDSEASNQQFPTIRIKEEIPKLENEKSKQKEENGPDTKSPYYTLLNLATSPNLYINYLKMLTGNNVDNNLNRREDEGDSQIQRLLLEGTNRGVENNNYNMSSEVMEQALSLVTHSASSS